MRTAIEDKREVRLVRKKSGLFMVGQWRGRDLMLRIFNGVLRERLGRLVRKTILLRPNEGLFARLSCFNSTRLLSMSLIEVRLQRR